MITPNQGLSSLTQGHGKMRDPGKEDGYNQLLYRQVPKLLWE